MKCPIDGSDLQEVSEQGLSYDECPSCKGIWMRMRALQTLFEQIDPDALISLPRTDDRIHKKEKTDTNNVTKCPHDGTPVYERMLGRVSVDVCPVCDSIWLDPGEFDAIKDELEHHELSNLFGRTIAHGLAHLVHFHWSVDDKAAEAEEKADEDE